MNSPTAALPLTRNCLDPWAFARITLKGFVAPCCVREPVGTLQDGLDAALTGVPIQALRTALLTGRLDRTCRDCHVQSSIDVPSLMRRWAREVLLRSKTLDASGVIDAALHPDVYRRFTFRNAIPGRHGLGERIVLCPNPSAAPPAIVEFPPFSAFGGERLQFIAEAEGVGTVEFVVAAGDASPLARVVVAAGSCVVRDIALPGPAADVRLTVAAHVVHGEAGALRGYVHYPVVHHNLGGGFSDPPVPHDARPTNSDAEPG